MGVPPALRRMALFGVWAAAVGWLAPGACRGQVLPDAPRMAWAALGVEVTVAVRTFPVRGRTLRDVQGEMARVGPLADGGRRGHALTAYRLSVDWTPDGSATGCRVAASRTRADIEVLLPEWPDEIDATEAEYAAWRSVVTSLEAHEARHRDLALAAAYQLARELPAQAAADCAALARRIAALTHRIEGELEERQARLDRESGG